MNQPSGLLSLPSELLGNIIHYFTDPDQWEKNNTNINWHYRFDKRVLVENEQRIRRQTICNLRLVNKRLRDAANHAFIPVLRIHLNKKSLDRAEEISKLTSMASGVRGIELILAYCPDNLANDLPVFTNFKTSKLNDLDSYNGWDFEYPDETNEEPTDSEQESIEELLLSGSFASRLDTLYEIVIADKETEQAKEEARACVRASMLWRLMQRAWHRDAVDSAQERKKPQEVRVLRQGHQRFQQLHAEQRELITTGTFATTLGKICSKLPGIQSLCLKDATRDTLDLLGSAERANMLVDPERLLHVLAEPLPWPSRTQTTLQGQEVAFHSETNILSSLLWDIPVALDRAGVLLRGLHVHALPNDQEFDLGTPGNAYLGCTEDDFRKSMSCLESFHFLPIADYRLTRLPTGLTAAQEREIANYIRLCTSSRRLKSLQLSLQAFEYRRSLPSHRRTQYIELVNALDDMEADDLHSICIENVCMPASNMQNLCSRLHAHLEKCILQQLYLYNGCWVGTVDLLRSRIGERVRSGKCQMELGRLYSEAMYKYYLADGTWSDLTRQRMTRLMTPEAQTDSEPSYISGERDTNPFAVYQQD